MRTVLASFLLLAACRPSVPSSPPPAAAATTAPSTAPDADDAPDPAVHVEAVPVQGATEAADSRKRWLGLTVANMNDPIPGAGSDQRAMITRAIRGSPAAVAGLRRGDVIVEAAGAPVSRYQDYIAQARKVPIGEKLAVVVLRDGARVPAQLDMIEQPADVNLWRKQKFPGNAAFDFDVPLLRPDGQRARSADRKGRPQLLYFWATWCGPCRGTALLVDALAKQAGDRLQVFAVSSEEEEVIRRYLASSHTAYPIARDDAGDLKLDYEVNKLPTAALIDADGQIVLWDYGAPGVRRAIDEAKKLLKLEP